MYYGTTYSAQQIDGRHRMHAHTSVAAAGITGWAAVVGAHPVPVDAVRIHWRIPNARVAGALIATAVDAPPLAAVARAAAVLEANPSARSWVAQRCVLVDHVTHTRHALRCGAAALPSLSLRAHGRHTVYGLPVEA
eukprot:COSAG01_NODE_24052_length_792_cov_1.151515_2_plen_135_part_01